MNEYELYKTRHELQGTTSNDSSVKRSKRMFNNKFESSASFYEVLVDGVLTDVIVNQGKLSNFKTLLFRPDTNVNKGDVVEYENKKYLIIDFDTNKVYPTAKLELCNYILSYTTGDIIDYLKDEFDNLILDDDGRPIPITIPGTSVDNPCIVRSNNYKLSDTEQILIPDNQLKVLMQYDVDKMFKVNDIVKFYDDDYKLYFIDHTQVIGDAGIVIYTFERVSDRVVS